MRVRRRGSELAPRAERHAPGLSACAALLLAATLLSGCGSIFGKDKPPGEVASPDVIYGRADAMLDQQSYEAAAKQYEEVELWKRESPEDEPVLLKTFKKEEPRKE